MDPLFCWHPKMSNRTDTFLRVYMASITPSVTRRYYQEFIQEACAAGASEDVLAPYKELLDAVPVYANCSEYVRYFHIPSSVNHINADSLSYLFVGNTKYNSKNFDQGVVVPEIDLQTITALAQALSGIIFSQSTSLDGYEEIGSVAIYSQEQPQDDILAWHYVDGVPTLWE